jgi:hypothetical protein
MAFEFGYVKECELLARTLEGGLTGEGVKAHRVILRRLLYPSRFREKR